MPELLVMVRAIRDRKRAENGDLDRNPVPEELMYFLDVVETVKQEKELERSGGQTDLDLLAEAAGA